MVATSPLAQLYKLNGTAPYSGVHLPAKWTCPSDGGELRLVPAGKSVIGSNWQQIVVAKRLDRDGTGFSLSPEAPAASVGLNAFYVGTFAVTNAQFARFLTAESPNERDQNLWLPSVKHIFPPNRERAAWEAETGFERHPVTQVSWYGAHAYCRWAGLRLPKEVEWEKAARGTDERLFPWGNEWRDDVLGWQGNTGRTEEGTSPVDSYSEGRSPYGLFQMVGNVEEWCEEPFRNDIYSRYARGDLTVPRADFGPVVVRGGAWYRRNRFEFRCAMRRSQPRFFTPGTCIGFRCACDASTVVAGLASSFISTISPHA
jgi:formylglycine-generating enzyme required for sulfatase activity